MKDQIRKKEYSFSDSDIDTASAEIERYLAENKIDKKDILRIRLGMEETLLRYRELLGEDKSFTLNLYKRMGNTNVAVTVPGSMMDPFIKNRNSEFDSSFMRAALTNMGELPAWKYSRGNNTVTYSISGKHISSWAQLILSIVLALVCATVLKLVPENICDAIHSGVLTPLLNTFMNLLSGIAGPMIFFAVVWGIYSIGDVSAFSVMGKKLLLRYLIVIAVATIAIGFSVVSFFNLTGGSAKLGSGFQDVFQMILNIVPSNVILAFTEGNTLQILFIAVIIGIAMIMIGERTQTVAIFAEQINYIVQLIMEFISKLVPFFVFGSLLDIILSNQIEDIAVSRKLFISNALACLALVIAYILVVSIRMKVSPVKFFKKALKTLIICITTASSAAAFSTSLETCNKEYGIDESLTNFGVPFGQVIFKPSVAILYLTSAFYAAEAFDVPVSLAWYVTAFIMSILLSVATPPIPGGALASISVLFTQLGLPSDGIAVVLALNIILDFIETPTDVFGGHSMLVLAADSFGMIDKETLRK